MLLHLWWGCRRGWGAATSHGDTWTPEPCWRCGSRAHRRSGCCSSGGSPGTVTARSGSRHVRAPEGECSCSVGLQGQRRRGKKTTKKQMLRWKQSRRGLFPLQANDGNYSSLSLASTSYTCLQFKDDCFHLTPPLSLPHSLPRQQAVFLQLCKNRKYPGEGADWARSKILEIQSSPANCCQSTWQ